MANKTEMDVYQIGLCVYLPALSNKDADEVAQEMREAIREEFGDEIIKVEAGSVAVDYAKRREELDGELAFDVHAEGRMLRFSASADEAAEDLKRELIELGFTEIDTRALRWREKHLPGDE